MRLALMITAAMLCTTAIAADRHVDAPTDESALAKMVFDGAAAYVAAPNDMLKAKTVHDRSVAMCTLFHGGAVKDWYGTVDQIDGDDRGNGILGVLVGTYFRLHPWNSGILDDLEAATSHKRSMIPAGSPLFDIAASLRKGQTIKFDGEFFPDKTTCLRETSLTRDGSMRAPEFLFRFTRIELIKPDD